MILLLHQSCEPDDVCNLENPSTPQLVFRLYDANQPSQLKSVDTLRVKDTENEISLMADWCDDGGQEGGRVAIIPKGMVKEVKYLKYHDAKRYN